MRLHPRRQLLPAVLTVSLLSLSFTVTRAADDKIYKQDPEIAPSMVRGEAGPKPKESLDLFRKGPVPSWIWGEDIKRRYFLRKEFKADSTAARIKATCDNHM